MNMFATKSFPNKLTNNDTNQNADIQITTEAQPLLNKRQWLSAVCLCCQTSHIKIEYHKSQAKITSPEVEASPDIHVHIRHNLY